MLCNKFVFSYFLRIEIQYFNVPSFFSLLPLNVITFSRDFSGAMRRRCFFHLTSFPRLFSVPPQGSLFQPKSIPRRPFSGLRGWPSGEKAIKNQRIFNIFMVPTFRRFWTLRTSKMHFREPSGARSGNVPSPLGPSWRAFRFSAPPPRGPQDASGR